MRAWRAAGVATVLLAVAAPLAGCGGARGEEKSPPPRLGAQVVQLRRDEVLGRVEIAVRNQAREQVVIDTLELQVPGYTGGGPQPKGEPLPPGQVVNLPTPYGEVRCPTAGDVSVGTPRVVLQVHTATDPTSRRVVVRPRDPQGLLHRIAAAECLTERLRHEVSLAFVGGWRATGSGADRVVHGTLRARLTVGQPRDITQLAGSVMFDLKADVPAGQVPSPLARLTPDRPEASVPVAVSLARCDGHTRGEIKKPFAFLVWLGPPGGTQLAVTPDVSDADKAAFRTVCGF